MIFSFLFVTAVGVVIDLEPTSDQPMIIIAPAMQGTIEYLLHLSHKKRKRKFVQTSFYADLVLRQHV